MLPPPNRCNTPVAVRVAQGLLILRLATLLALLVSAAGAAMPVLVVGPAIIHLPKPDGRLADGLLIGSVGEAALALRIGWMHTASRHLVVAVELLVVAGSMAYAVAGALTALAPGLLAVTVVALLRLQHVRDAFDRVRAHRRLVGRPVTGPLFSGYAPPEPTAPKPRQPIGYWAGVDCPLWEPQIPVSDTTYPAAASRWPESSNVPLPRERQPRDS